MATMNKGDDDDDPNQQDSMPFWQQLVLTLAPVVVSPVIEFVVKQIEQRWMSPLKSEHNDSQPTAEEKHDEDDSNDSSATTRR